MSSAAPAGVPTRASGHRRARPSLATRECALEYDMALEAAREGLLAFTCFTMPDYEVSWHHRLMAHTLNRFARGEIDRLIVCMPPRHGKSQLASRHLPAYLMGRNPDESIIACSYSAELSSRMNRDVQRIIDSDAYQEVFPGTRLNSSNVRTTSQGSWLRNSDIFEVVGERGVYRCSGVGGGITGMGGKTCIVDDPVKNAEEAASQIVRDRIWEWYSSTLYTRLEKNGRILVIMTRWHQDDLVGRLLSQMKNDPESEKWTVVNLTATREKATTPGENDAAAAAVAAAAAHDPREVGESLWPNKYNAKRLSRVRTTVGEKVWASLYQQRPSPMGGGIVKDHWWRYYHRLPERLDRLIFSADLTFKDTEKSDFSVFQVWGVLGADRYLLDQRRARMGFNEQEKVMLALAQQYPHFQEGIIEEAANGAALVDRLRSRVAGLIAVPARGSKVARAESVAPQIEAGNVYLPHPTVAPWVLGFTHEFSVFPNGEHDDQVDACSQALKRLAPAHRLDDLQFISVGRNSSFL